MNQSEEVRGQASAEEKQLYSSDGEPAPPVKAAFRVETRERRILASGTWVDADGVYHNECSDTEEMIEADRRADDGPGRGGPYAQR